MSMDMGPMTPLLSRENTITNSGTQESGTVDNSSGTSNSGSQGNWNDILPFGKIGGHITRNVGKVAKNVGKITQNVVNATPNVRNIVKFTWCNGKWNRVLIVEPILGVLATVSVPFGLAFSFYVYSQFQEEAIAHFNLNASQLDFHHSCGGKNYSPEVAMVTKYAQNHNSMFLIINGLCGSVPCIITIMFIGPYSDTGGRRYAIILPLIGIFLSAVFTLLIFLFKLNLWYLLIAAFIEGAFGSNYLLLLGCYAYIVDTNDEEKLHFRLTLVELIMIIPAVIGPIGYFIFHIGYSTAVVAMLVGTSAVMIYAIFLVPETIPTGPFMEIWKIHHLKGVIKLFTVDTEPKRMKKLRWLYFAFVPIMIVTYGDKITVLFLKNKPFCWDSEDIGIYIGVYIAVSGVGGVVLAKVLKYVFKDDEIGIISGIASTVKYIYHAFVWDMISVYFIPFSSMFDLLFTPVARSLMAKLVGTKEQGKVFSALAISQVISSFLGNLLFTTLYAVTDGIMSGFVYLIMAAMYAFGTAAFMAYVAYFNRDQKYA